MPTTRQGMNSTKIEQIVAQRVTNAIEAIAIYETKIRVAHNLAVRDGTDISQKDEKPSKKQQNRTRDGKVCEDEAQSKSSQLREEKAKKNIT
ncbi:hypothetical protein Tco_0503955 [Tanacetum coccineum]